MQGDDQTIPPRVPSLGESANEVESLEPRDDAEPIGADSTAAAFSPSPPPRVPRPGQIVHTSFTQDLQEASSIPDSAVESSGEDHEDAAPGAAVGSLQTAAGSRPEGIAGLLGTPVAVGDAPAVESSSSESAVVASAAEANASESRAPQGQAAESAPETKSETALQAPVDADAHTARPLDSHVAAHAGGVAVASAPRTRAEAREQYYAKEIGRIEAAAIRALEEVTERSEQSVAEFTEQLSTERHRTAELEQRLIAAQQQIDQLRDSLAARDRRIAELNNPEGADRA